MLDHRLTLRATVLGAVLPAILGTMLMLAPVSAALAAEPPPNMRQAQDILRKKGFDVGTPDGVAGAKTRHAIQAFQRAQGLPVTGELNVNTWQRLRAPAAAAPAAPAAPAAAPPPAAVHPPLPRPAVAGAGPAPVAAAVAPPIVQGRQGGTMTAPAPSPARVADTGSMAAAPVAPPAATMAAAAPPPPPPPQAAPAPEKSSPPWWVPFLALSGLGGLGYVYARWRRGTSTAAATPVGEGAPSFRS
jgi:hypothetical protein